MKPTTHSSLVATLRKVDGFDRLSLPQLQRISDACASEEFPPGARIVTQGDIGESFYVLREGEVIVTKDDEIGGEVELVRLGRGSFFGERALLHDEPRAAHVSASDKGCCECAVVSRSIFREVAGEIGSALRKTHQKRVEQAAILSDGRHHARFVEVPGGGVEQKMFPLEARALALKYAGSPFVPRDGFFGVFDGFFEGKESARRVSVKWRGVGISVDAGTAKGLLRERELLTSLNRENDALVPRVLASEVTASTAALVFERAYLADLHGLLERRDFPPDDVAFCAACVRRRRAVRSSYPRGAVLREDVLTGRARRLL